MNVPVLITDFSRAYANQGFTDALTAAGVGFEVLDMTALEGTRCYCDDAAASEIRGMIAPYAGKPGLHWIDSGDFHYMSLFFAEVCTEPFTLVLLDNHTDDREPEFPGILSCGSWVKVLRESCPLLKETVTIGPEGARPPFPEPLGAVYLSIDKDILSPEYARTDWSQGVFSLHEVENLVSQVFSLADRVLGVDICGELSSDHGAGPEDGRINLETNLALFNLITRLYV